MEQEPRNRRRRSIRNLRRSSGFFTESFTPAIEVEELQVDSKDDNLVSAYGSIWVEGDNVGKDTDSLVICVSDKTRHVEQDSLDVSHHCENQPVLPSAPSGCDFSRGSFSTGGDDLSNHQSLISGSCVSSMLDSDLRNVTLLSLYDPGIGSALCPQSLRQPIVYSDVGMSCGEPCPQTLSVPSTHVSNNLRKSVSQDDVCFVRQNLSLSHYDKVCIFNNIRLYENLYHDENIQKENIQFSNEVVKPVSAEVVRNILAEKLSESASVSEPSDAPTVVSLKERRKSDRRNERPDTVKDSECKPKKRKRLSLKKIPQDSTDLEPDNVEKHVGTNSNTKISIGVENENNNHEIFEKVINEHSANTCNVNFTSASEWVDASKWSENLQFITCVDPVTNKEIDFEKDFFFPDFQVSASEKKSKRRSQSKAKAARRSSRLFNANEMPLHDLSLEQIPDLELLSSRASKNELCKFETNSPVTVNCSPEFSGRKKTIGENKENIADVHVHTTGKREEQDAEYLDKAVGSDNLFVKDGVEGVVEDFANLRMNGNRVTQGSDSIQHWRQNRWRDDSAVQLDTFNVTDANVYSREVDKDGIPNMSPHDDIISGCNNLLDSSTSPENVSSVQEVSINFVKCVVDYEEEDNGNMEDQQSCLDTAFSSPSADVDLEELLSLDNTPTQHETDASSISESGKCIRLRRGRKSWDTSKQLNPDVRKKPARRKSKQGNTEEQTATLVNSNNIGTSAHAPMDEQSDNDSESKAISPGLLSLYRNKNFVPPQRRSWETIKESPKSRQVLFTKQRHKCFLEFENGITRAKLQRRHKKALDVYKKIGGPPSAISDKEFEQKMLDIQISIDS